MIRIRRSFTITVAAAAVLTASCTVSEPSTENVGVDEAAVSTQALGSFSRYCGKVNIHTTPSGWAADSDCTSGCNLGGLDYCKKFWPAATAVRQIPVSAKANNVWRTAGCGAIQDDFDGTDQFECIAASAPACGDGTCNFDKGETPASCASDCGTCGDGTCNGGENYVTCSSDCGMASTCGDGLCNNGESPSTCARDCRAPTVLVNTVFPNGVLQFASDEDVNSLFHAIAADPAAAASVPSGFKSLQGYLAQFPVNDTNYEVTRDEFQRDLKWHVIDEEALQALVNPDLQLVAGNKLYQFTDIGVFRVDLDKAAWFKDWLASHRDSIDTDPNYKSVPGEVSLGNNEFQVAPGVVRIDTQDEKMAGSDPTAAAAASSDRQAVAMIEPPMDPPCEPGGCGGGGGGGGPAACGPVPEYDTYTVGSGFSKSTNRRLGNRRFVFKTKKINLYVYRSIGIKGKMQRRKKFIFGYWGPSYADEIAVGWDNVDLHTNFVPYAGQFGRDTRPNFKKLPIPKDSGSRSRPTRGSNPT